MPGRGFASVFANVRRSSIRRKPCQTAYRNGGTGLGLHSPSVLQSCLPRADIGKVHETSYVSPPESGPSRGSKTVGYLVKLLRRGGGRGHGKKGVGQEGREEEGFSEDAHVDEPLVNPFDDESLDEEIFDGEQINELLRNGKAPDVLNKVEDPLLEDLCFNIEVFSNDHRQKIRDQNDDLRRLEFRSNKIGLRCIGPRLLTPDKFVQELGPYTLVIGPDAAQMAISYATGKQANSLPAVLSAAPGCDTMV
ncbi:hypothetical protein F5X99DRAFT_182022 [Biscogniauxia marginata]|nr:hypothetical protein F5X99DRAFT_182022 [Biscogniauxia marginata]